ncbi:MAG: T9SS type A sorting domain-containing protein [Bacteroidetes bacterium]|nr:T9SS type A sorting domain-containing protein [Bacteroidota bacterium]
MPNPSKGNFKLNFYGNEEASVSIRIIDLTGNTIINEQFNAEIGFNTKDFNLEGLSKGFILLN